MSTPTRLSSMGLLLVVLAVAGTTRTAVGQTFGVELHNNLMPASGGMGGVSIARPQDLVSGLNGNPGSLTQFRGTQFHFGGGWGEATFNMTQSAPIPAIGPALVDPFSGKSSAPGAPAGNIGITQDLSELGLPATIGIGFVTTSGAFVDFRQIPASNGTNAGMAIFSLPMTAAINLTDRLAVGTTMALGISFFDGPFVGVGGMTPDYALRGTLGTSYLLDQHNTLGAYYQTEQSFKYDNAFLVNPGQNQQAVDVAMELPENIGIGIANTSLMNGRLLVGVDVLYKFWDDTALFGAIYDNQLVVQLGTQYSVGRYRLRGGYAWAENPIDQTPGSNLGGVIQPGNLRAVRYSQGLMAVTCQNRISGGLGIVDFLPGIDMDLMAGGMFGDTEQLGDSTTTSIESYWLGFGLTWRFGRGSCESVAAPDRFGSCQPNCSGIPQ